MKSLGDTLRNVHVPPPRRSRPGNDDGYETEYGYFSREELEQNGYRETYDSNGELLLQAPDKSSPLMGPHYRDIPEYVVDGHEDYPWWKAGES